MGGLLYKKDVKGYPISVSVMNRMVFDGLVVWNEKVDMWQLPPGGNKCRVCGNLAKGGYCWKCQQKGPSHAVERS
jgi:hypothetical protein